jgi:hypothetical protein
MKGHARLRQLQSRSATPTWRVNRLAGRRAFREARRPA